MNVMGSILIILLRSSAIADIGQAPWWPFLMAPESFGLSHHLDTSRWPVYSAAFSWGTAQSFGFIASVNIQGEIHANSA